MTDRFSLRFVLSSGRPVYEDLLAVWPDGPVLRRHEDGIVEVLAGARPIARLDLLKAEDSRGKALLQAIRREAERHGDEEAASTVRFVIDHASGVVVASPILEAEDDIEVALDPLDALWEHLFQAHGGLLQVDGEGIYSEDGPLVEL